MALGGGGLIRMFRGGMSTGDRGSFCAYNLTSLASSKCGMQARRRSAWPWQTRVPCLSSMAWRARGGRPPLTWPARCVGSWSPHGQRGSPRVSASTWQQSPWVRCLTTRLSCSSRRPPGCRSIKFPTLVRCHHFCDPALCLGPLKFVTLKCIIWYHVSGQLARGHLLHFVTSPTLLSRTHTCSGPRIAAKCGALPLTVNLVGSALSGKAEASWKAMEDTLVRATPEAGRRDGLASVMAAVEVSVAELHVLRYRFRDLCAFRPGAPLPVGLLAAFWERLAEPLTHRDTELVLEALAERGLLEASDLALVYRVPALQAQYLDETTPPDGVREVQRRFVVAVCAAFGCEPSHAGIDGDARDGLVAVDWEATAGSDVGAYCIRFLVHHLIGAGWVGTAVRLLTGCFSFLAARAAADNVLGIIADCEAAAKAAAASAAGTAADTSAGGTNHSGIADLVALADLLRLSFPVLADDPSQLWFQLCGRLSMPDRLEECSGVLQALALSAAARGRETGRLLPIGRVLRPPGGARRAVLRTSESSTVVALTPSPFGTVAAADLGGRVRIWDTSLCLVASEAESPWTEPESSGADPPPHQHAPGNADDVELGEPDESPLPPPPPPPPTTGMGGAPLPPSRPVASAATSAPLMRHLVFSADGRALVGCGDRGVVAVWKAASGSLVARFAVAGATSLYGLALSADETRVCVGGADKTLYMLKIRTGKAVAAVRAAHRMRITAVAIVEPAKPIVISASLDRTIQVCFCFWIFFLFVLIPFRCRCYF